MLLVPDFRKVARDLEQHPLVGGGLTRPLLSDPFVKVGNRCAQSPGYFEQPSGRHTIDASLVFVGLLIGHADYFGELLLGETQHNATFPDPAADVIVDRGG
jgi:hypothetical protein